jgi:dipeptidyl aminopeptidase/acylaminoacyl peptidase
MGERRAFGTWPSPLSPQSLAAAGLRFGHVAAQDAVLWMETRPDEGGRTVLVRACPGEAARDIVPPGVSVRTRVNEYGGAAFWPAGEAVILVEGETQDLYRLDGDGTLERLTEAPGWRFADGVADLGRGRTLAVAEREGADGSQAIIAVPLSGGAFEVLAAGRDFYAAPRLSPDGRQFAYLAWDLPHMPWEAAELWLAELDEAGRVGSERCVAGGMNRAAFQPEFAPNGTLHAVLENGEGSRVERLGPQGWEGAAGTPGEALRPLWALGSRSYAILPDGALAVGTVEQGAHALYLAAPGETPQRVDLALASLDMPAALSERRIAALATFPNAPSAIVAIDLERPARHAILRASGVLAMGNAGISHARPLALDSGTGVIHALYYPPTHAHFEGLPGEHPPMVVSAHGGPTGQADRGLSPRVQFWTSRGFAYLDVDYRGSTGYGPGYRRALDGQMGRLDAADLAAAAQAAARQGLADEARLLASGSSAGGHVVLMALATTGVFRAGCSRYGIADLARLAETTHRFESGYLDRLSGVGPGIDRRLRLRERSPLDHVAHIGAPVLVLQGLEDPIVPPEQSRMMAQALRERGVPVALVEFEGEGHGFRSAEAVERAIAAEHAFYVRILGLPTDAAPLDIANLG